MYSTVEIRLHYNFISLRLSQKYLDFFSTYNIINLIEDMQ